MRLSCFHSPLAAVEVEACSEGASSFAVCERPRAGLGLELELQLKLELELELGWL